MDILRGVLQGIGDVASSGTVHITDVSFEIRLSWFLYLIDCGFEKRLSLSERNLVTSFLAMVIDLLWTAELVLVSFKFDFHHLLEDFS